MKMSEEMEFVVSGVSKGRGARWNYELMAEMVEKTIREAVEKNIDEARKIAASTAKSAKVKLYLKKSLVQKIAESGKSGEQPSYKMQVKRIKEAIKQILGLKVRSEGDGIVLTLTPSDIQKYLSEIEEREEE